MEKNRKEDKMINTLYLFINQYYVKSYKINRKRIS